MSRALDAVHPQQGDVAAAVAALPRVRDYLTEHPDAEVVRIRVDGGTAAETLSLPRPALELLARVLMHMAKGKAVSVVPSSSELTTQQAADLLNVSRPFLIGLLDAGRIDYRLVGTHRRILAESLLAYRRADDRRRSDAADELTALGEEMGLL